MEESTPFESRQDLNELEGAVEKVKNEIGKFIVGQHNIVELLIVALLCEGHVLLEGMPGVAKTLTAKLLAKTVDADFSRIQFTPDLMPSDVLGTVIYNNQKADFEFKKGPIFSNIVLIDEINRAPAKTQAALFECMEEKQVTVDGVTHKLAPPFLVIGTQNPIDHEGTYRLPEAQLDRFLFKLEVDYPTLEEESAILKSFHAHKHLFDVEKINAVLTPEQLRKFQSQISDVVVKDDLFNYIAQIVHETRNNPSLFLGASPRASLSILQASKVMAAISLRDFVTPEDVKKVLIPVLNHRITLTPEREMEGRTPKEIMEQIIQKIEVPR